MVSMAFSIDGAYLTRVCRDLVIEGSHEKAMAILESGLPGLPIGECSSILAGTRKLVGVNSFHVEDDSDEEHIREVQWLYAGVLFKDGLYWQPYAVVDGWDRSDVRPDLWAKNMWCRTSMTNCLNRSVAYMDDQIQDRVESVFSDTLGSAISLWKQVNAPPRFVCLQESWQSAFSEYETVRGGIERRSAQARSPVWGDEDEAAENVPVKYADLGPIPELPGGRTIDPMMATLAGQAGMTPEQAVGLFGSGPTDVEESAPGACRRGWVSPEGKCYGCLYGEHDKVAALLDGDEDDPSQSLLKKRWAKFYDRTAFSDKPSIVSRGHLTDAQRDAMEEWCLAFRFSFEEAYDQTVAEW